MPEEQKCIYFAAGDDTDRLGKLPNAQLVLSKGYDLLLCTEDVDEFCLQMMRDYKEKEFKNINSGDLGLETEDEKKAAEAAETENKDLFEEIKKDLNGKVAKYAELLYDQALLIAGLPIEDPVAYAQLVCGLMQ